MSMMLLLSDDAPTPRSLFAAGEQGFWYDPSDFSTLFQDAAGTTPVTAVGQSVGLVLDKSKGLVLGPEKSAYSSGFTSTSGISGVGATVSVVSNELTITSTSTDGSDRGEVPLSGLTVGATYAVTIIARRGAQGTGQQIFNWTVGSVPATIIAGPTNQTVAFVFVATAASGVARFYSQVVSGSVGDSLIVSSLSVRELTGNHATQSTALSRPTLQQDSTGRYYLSFDGTDDGMATPSINFTGTDKMTVWAGVRKLSDAAAGIAVELSAASSSNAGAISIRAPQTTGAGGNYGATSGGSIAGAGLVVSGTVLSPDSSVITYMSNIGSDTSIIRRNGSQSASNSSDQGTGTYGNYPLYIGRRGGTTLPFNGRIYQLIGRGAETPLAQIQAMERYVNAKTGAF